MGKIPWKWEIGAQSTEPGMVEKSRRRPHKGLGLTQADVWGCGGGRLEAGWKQNTVLIKNSSFELELSRKMVSSWTHLSTPRL